MDVRAAAQDAFAQIGVEARVPVGAHAASADLTIDLDGTATEIELKRRSLVDAKTAERLIAEFDASHGLLLVVGDRVTEDARRHLLAARAGYLDMRGHLGIRANGMLINADVPGAKQERDRADALAGKVGLEVAAHLLLSPSQPVAVRALARDLGRSPSTVSAVLGALRRDGIIDTSNTVVDTALFWRLAEKWPQRRSFAAVVPDDADPVMTQALRLGLGDLKAPGWALTDTAAAASYGAPVAFRAGQKLDFLVPDESVLRRAVRLLGTADSAERAAVSLRVAPVPVATHRRIDLGGPAEWPLAHPLFVALDLAQDSGRGREILDAWNPDERWTRVW